MFALVHALQEYSQGRDTEKDSSRKQGESKGGRKGRMEGCGARSQGAQLAMPRGEDVQVGSEATQTS